MSDFNPFDTNFEDLGKSVDKTFVEGTLSNTTTPFGNTLMSQRPPEVGEPLGSGAVVSPLGEGGMAHVFKIWNEKLEVHRAVKILKPNSPNELVLRFETESKITAKLHHPNIVEIYNVGEWNGLPYIEMEIVEGLTLDTLVSKYGNLPPSVCTAIGIQVVQALLYAHSQEFLLYGKTYQGVIHRDLKPANIMITQRGALKLMDFGIARPTEVGLHTMDGHIVGTLQYLSPEQLDGVSIDHRTDIYSLGTILYEMLTGTKTFPQLTITNLMKMKATNQYRKFNEFSFYIANSLVKITEKCLQIERDNRFPDTQTLLQDLEKTFAAFTNSIPAELLQEFMGDPETYEEKKTRRKKTPLSHMFMAAGILLVSIIIAFLIAIIPNQKDAQVNQKEKSVVPIVNPDPVPPPPTAIDTIKKITVNREAKKNTTVFAGKKRPVKEKTRMVQKNRPKERGNKNVEQTIGITVSDQKSNIAKLDDKPVAQSPLDKLKFIYDTNDLLAIGERACKKGNYSDAIIALQAVPGQGEKKILYHLWALVELGKIGDAQLLSKSQKKKDAFADLLRGRIEAESNNDRAAINHYAAALTKPSIIKNNIDIRKDALFYTALIHDRHYKQSPNQETRFQALTAWNNLKKVYTATPDHPRFRMANQRLAGVD